MNHFSTNLMEILYQGKSIDELIRKEIEKAVNELLQTELTAFLDYEKYDILGYGSGNSRSGNSRNGRYERKLQTRFGEITVLMPRNRKGEFTAVTVPPYKRSTEDLGEIIIKFYQKGMTTREIAELTLRMYGAHYSPQTISNLTQVMEEQVKAFHTRPTQAYYPVIYLDATWLHVRRDSVAKEAVHVLLGIDEEGHKEILDYAIYPSESCVNYTELLRGLKERGVEKVDLFVSDGLPGIRYACLEVFPASMHQSCWVHLSRSLGRYVRAKDRKEVLDALKKVYRADTVEKAKEELALFLETFKKRYPKLQDKLHQDDPSLFSFFSMPKEIRSSIYTTNFLEGFNKQLKRYTKRKEQFPNEDSLDRFICTVCLEYNKKFSSRVHKGFGQLVKE